ncbi:Oidioi.mRNA.OKI2018_I69.chr1.g1943.t1.cds [Oikopleura dioica]|uniref:Oidioi.mRNA.OKI2018_I69.chr1.g1943.t1.cds n=1 Tax=Oikopleura dioica TaxID=34765 RepID=A0ABN7SR73_OIKDI|nr:Oidioi.mRNA.OKI2018_I69.chr1.g1943.t1.cds [Oikopleura dioica]
MVDPKKIFAEFDSDKRGYLNRKEVPDAIRCCGLNPSEEDIMKAFRTTNCTTTKVQENQFHSLVKELRKTSLPDETRLRAAFKSLEDGSDSGLIPAADLSHMLKSKGEKVSQKVIDDLLSLIDVGVTTDIDYEELIALLTADLEKAAGF